MASTGKDVLRTAVRLILLYICSWSLSYVLLMGFDFRYYLRYLSYAWSGPGELPFFIQVLTLLLCLTFLGCRWAIKTYLKGRIRRARPR